MKAAWLLLAFVAGALAGCTEEPARPVDDLAIEPGEGSAGSLLVVVVTPDLRPIAGATVQVGALNASTDDTGSARLEALQPGSLVLKVSKTGFRPATQAVDIVAGNETRTDVKLLPGEDVARAEGPEEPAAGPQAYKEVFHLRGFFDCSATYLIITGDCMLVADFALDEAFGAVNETPPARPGDATDEEFVLEFPLDFDWRTVVAEMHWDATTTAGEKMTFAVEPAQAPDDGHAAKYGRAEGASPLLVRIDPGVPHENATPSADGEEPDMPNAKGGEVLRTRSYVQGEFHRPGGTAFLGVGAALQQEFDVFVTVFYGEPAPEGYRIGS